MANEVRFSDTGMILAAGFGTRMRPLSNETPKPLLEVGGKTMLDRAIAHYQKAGLSNIVVNAHYLADQIADHLSQSDVKGLILSREEEVLDTGGGVKKARNHFGDLPFFVMGSDLPWIDGGTPALRRMKNFWDAEKMDALLLLYPKGDALGFHGKGDFMMEKGGRLWRRDAPAEKPFVWLSVMLVRPQLYDEVSATIFSNNKILDMAEEKGRLYGLVHDGAAFHVGTPEDLEEANARLMDGRGWKI